MPGPWQIASGPIRPGPPAPAEPEIPHPASPRLLSRPNLALSASFLPPTPRTCQPPPPPPPPTPPPRETHRARPSCRRAIPRRRRCRWATCTTLPQARARGRRPCSESPAGYAAYDSDGEALGPHPPVPCVAAPATRQVRRRASESAAGQGGRRPAVANQGRSRRDQPARRSRRAEQSRPAEARGWRGRGRVGHRGRGACPRRTRPRRRCRRGSGAALRRARAVTVPRRAAPGRLCHPSCARCCRARGYGAGSAAGSTGPGRRVWKGRARTRAVGLAGLPAALVDIPPGVAVRACREGRVRLGGCCSCKELVRWRAASEP